MPIAYPLINGNRYDFSSVELNVAGALFNGVKEITYSQTLEPGIVRGNRAQVIGRTRGPLDAEGNLTLYKLEFQSLIAALQVLGAPTGAGFMEVPFDVVVNYAEVGQPVITDTLRGCRIKKYEDTGAEGGEAIATSVDLHIMLILSGGLPPIAGKQLLR